MAALSSFHLNPSISHPWRTDDALWPPLLHDSKMYHVIINEQISKYLELYLDTTEPLVDILLHEPLEDGDSFLAQPDWVEHVVVEDGLEQVVFVIRLNMGTTINTEALLQLILGSPRREAGRPSSRTWAPPGPTSPRWRRSQAPKQRAH